MGDSIERSAKKSRLLNGLYLYLFVGVSVFLGAALVVVLIGMPLLNLFSA